MQNKDDTSKGSHWVSYLTPSKRPPALLTRVTKPAKVEVPVDKLSPLFIKSPHTQVPLNLTDVCQSALGTFSSCGIPKAPVQDITIPSSHATTKTTKPETNLKPSSIKMMKSSNRFAEFQEKPPQKHEIHPASQDILRQIEIQVISSKPSLVDDNDSRTILSESDGLVVVDEQMDHISTKPNSIPKLQQRIPYAHDTHHSNPASVCSSCSGDDSMPGLSRNSFCDGCSSTGSMPACNGPSVASIFPYTNVADDRCNVCNFHRNSQENLNHWAEDLFESQMSLHKTDGSLSPSHVSPSHEHNFSDRENIQHLRTSCLKKLSLNNEQLIFLMLRVILSKYKTLMANVDQEQRIQRSQRLTIAYLIQAVIVLSRRCRSSTDQWHKMQADLKLVQMKNEELRKSQRKVYVIVCMLVLINVLKLSPVQQRLMSCFRFFGIVETIKKINRTRRMIANNWRNIPLLLTDFWRIFIFRSNMRRNL